MQQPVGGEGVAAWMATPLRSVKRPPDSSTITCRPAISHRSYRALDRDVDRPSATSMCAKKSPSPRRGQAPRPAAAPALSTRTRDRVLDRTTARHGWVRRPRNAPPLLGPPAPVQRRRRHDAHLDHAVEARARAASPTRAAPREAPGAVDRVEDPAPQAVALGARSSPRTASPGRSSANTRRISPRRRDGLGHRREVGLRLDHQVGAKRAIEIESAASASRSARSRSGAHGADTNGASRGLTRKVGRMIRSATGADQGHRGVPHLRGVETADAVVPLALPERLKYARGCERVRFEPCLRHG